MDKKNITWILKSSENSDKIHILHSPDKRFLGHQDLPNGNDVILTIKEVGFAEVLNPVTKKTTEKKVIQFKENFSWVKPFIVNATNAKMIYKVAERRFMDDLIGRKIQIGVDKTKFANSEVDCLRVRDIKSSKFDYDFITPEQVKEIKDLISMQNSKTENDIIEAYKIDSLEKLSKDKFTSVVNRLKSIINE